MTSPSTGKGLRASGERPNGCIDEMPLFRVTPYTMWTTRICYNMTDLQNLSDMGANLTRSLQCLAPNDRHTLGTGTQSHRGPPNRSRSHKSRSKSKVRSSFPLLSLPRHHNTNILSIQANFRLEFRSSLSFTTHLSSTGTTRVVRVVPVRWMYLKASYLCSAALQQRNWPSWLAPYREAIDFWERIHDAFQSRH